MALWHLGIHVSRRPGTFGCAYYLNHIVTPTSWCVEQDVVPWQAHEPLDTNGVVDGDAIGDQVAHLHVPSVAMPP